MAIFKNFKCPNGNPPEHCLHIPQIINTIASYFIKKKHLSEIELNKHNKISQHVNNSQPVSKKQKQR